MKEYCLVPRNLAEKLRSPTGIITESFISPETADVKGSGNENMSFHQSTVGGGFISPQNRDIRGGAKEMSRESESIQQILKKLIKREKRLPMKKHNKRVVISKRQILPKPMLFTKVNPPLEHIISVSFSSISGKYALALLKFFENKKDIEWDEFGELKRPISGVNLIELIKKLIMDKTPIDDEDFQSYKLFLNAANVPYSLIRNNSARKQLLLNLSSLPKGKGWVSYI